MRYVPIASVLQDVMRWVGRSMVPSVFRVRMAELLLLDFTQLHGTTT